MKPTNRNMGKYFNIAPQTLSTYDNSKKGIEKKRLYEAMKKYFIEQHPVKIEKD